MLGSTSHLATAMDSGDDNGANPTATPAATPAVTMRAVTQHAYGSAEVLTVETVERPTPEADEVLIEIVSAGLDRGVWHLMTGLPYLVRIMGFGFSKPKNPIPGFDVAGRVVAIGDEVTRFAPGDEVFGIGSATFAQYATAKESKLAAKPANVSFDEAAAASISGVTALQALTKIGQVEAGQQVLIIGASGGVGSFAVQLAKAYGAIVTGVASTAKLEAVRTIGADHVVDYTATAIDETGRHYDLIIDTGGRNPLSRIRRALAPTGTLVIVGGEDGDKLTGGIGRQIGASLLSLFVKQRLTFFIASESLDYIEPLTQHLADGTVTPTIGQRFTLDQVPDAIRAMEAGALTGKSVITIGR